MTQERLNSLALLSIETNVLRGIDTSSLINDLMRLKNPVSITFIGNLQSENIHVNYAKHFTFNVYILWCYIFCLNYTQIVLLM